MRKNILSCEVISFLKEQHRLSKTKREADKIKSVYLSGLGYSNKEISLTLLLDEDTISSYLNKYRKGGLHILLKDNYSGCLRYLNDSEIKEFSLYLEKNPVRNTRDAIKYVKEKYHAEYGQRGMALLLKSMGFTYKKTRTVPGKADTEKQREFAEKYRNLIENKGKDRIYFADAAHPHHNVENGVAWIKKI